MFLILHDAQKHSRQSSNVYMNNTEKSILDQNQNTIWLNNQYDYYKERLIETNLLNHTLKIEYTLIVPLGKHRILGSVNVYEYKLAQQIIKTLKHHNYPNIQLAKEYVTKQTINTNNNKIISTQYKKYYCIYFSTIPINLQQWYNTTTHSKGLMFGYKHSIIF